jgi:signal transduction histidine kinase
MITARAGRIVCRTRPMFRPIINFLTRPAFGGPDDPVPPEAIMLRLLGLAWLVVFIAATATTAPVPGLHGKGLGVTAGLLLLVVCAVATQPRVNCVPQRRRMALLLGVGAASALLAAVQPHGIWELGAYFVGIMAAMRLERAAAALTLGITLVVLVLICVLEGRGGAAVSITTGAVPWFLVIRLFAETRRQADELRASQAAQAEAARMAERGRIAREMHDVLAHSLSALALQLETTRLLARDRGTDPQVLQALDEAHHLAAGGLEEARRAISAARGDELPGPERLPALGEAFEEQSGVRTVVSVDGEPRPLEPDARLALYRTAQVALTNIRKHATAELVELRLEYRHEATVLSIEDRSGPGAPPPPEVAQAGGGFGLTGMRERAELLGGRLTAEPTSNGFRVELWLPADAAAREASPEAAIR